MASRRKKPSFGPADVAGPSGRTLTSASDRRREAARERQQAFESSKRAYVRLRNGKPPHRALIEDKKLQHDLRDAVESLREATIALSEAPKRRVRKSAGSVAGRCWSSSRGGIALAASEQLRSKVLDTLFGAEEEFEYTPPPPPAPAPPASPVSSA